ncbi:MAG: 2-oxo acid dehydrogenase subunit E2 [Myxococcales bacterium]|nr:2-oxo acid dehydrogenase subunit E2 [Myxococcales bacterium]
MYDFKLPDLGEGIHEGEILEWHVTVGQSVAEDDPLVEIETDKAAVTIPSPRAGVVVATNGDVGEVVKVGQVLVSIEDNGASASSGAVAVAASASSASETAPGVTASTRSTPTAPAASAPRSSASAASASSTAATSSGKSVPAKGAGSVAQPASAPRVSAAPVALTAPVASVPLADRNRPVPAAPATRRLARELGVDLYAVVGSGPGGRVTAEDVERYAQGSAAPASATSTGGDAAARGAESADEAVSAEAFPEGGSAIPFLEVEPLPDFSRWGPVETEPVRSIRRKIAKRMVTSMVLVPHVCHMEEADVTELDELRRAEKGRLSSKPGGKLSLLPFVMRAVVRCLKDFPMFNASLDPFRGELVYKKYYHVGVAADTPRGLIVPVVRDADHRTVLELSAEVERLASAARDGSLGVEELQGGSFTITNVGAIGGTGMVPTINYPEVAILGLARAQQKPVVRNGRIDVRLLLPMTLAFDHRIADGANAARFMNQLVYLLADPRRLLLES